MPETRFSTDQLREFVIAGHWNLPKVQDMLVEFPEILNAPYQWAKNDRETAIQAAAHAGSPHVAEFLLSKGAPLAICTAAMLGRQANVKHLLGLDPAAISARGAHGIPLLAHAALSGDVALVEMLYRRGAQEGNSMALSNAVNKGHLETARWLLANAGPDLAWKNYEGKNALTIATEQGNQAMIDLLREHGAS